MYHCLVLFLRCGVRRQDEAVGQDSTNQRSRGRGGGYHPADRSHLLLQGNALREGTVASQVQQPILYSNQETLGEEVQFLLRVQHSTVIYFVYLANQGTLCQEVQQAKGTLCHETLREKLSYASSN